MAERSEVIEQEAVRDASPAYSGKAEAASAEAVPPGYKRTEAGVIPEDWQIGPLMGQGKAYGGLTGKTGQDFGVGKAKYVPFLGVMDRNVLDESCLEAVRVAPNEAQNPVKAGDILLTGSSETPEEVAMPALVNFNLPRVYLNSFCFGYRLNDRATFHKNFLVYLIRSEIGRSVVAPLAQGSTRHNISKRALLRAPLPCPPLQEQRAIATALSDADALIESLDRLIAKKRAIKQAAMQQLLTGQTRLPGFTGEWETKRLGEIGTFYKGQGIRRDDVSEEGVPCIRYGEIYTRYGDCVVAPESRIPNYVSESAFPLRSGDILFAGSGETAEEIGMCVAYLGEQPAFAGGDIVVLRPSGGVSAYLGRLLNHPTIAQQKSRLGQGDAVVHISARNLAQIEVHLPHQEEQTAIATVLSDMDTEIEALEHRRDKARQIKQGMMQQLLTGRVRLVEPETAEPATC